MQDYDLFSRHRVAMSGLSEGYLAPVPSQFLVMPRAMSRCGPEWEVCAYTRALAMDVLAMTGCLDARGVDA
jgi:hypothetical protein